MVYLYRARRKKGLDFRERYYIILYYEITTHAIYIMLNMNLDLDFYYFDMGKLYKLMINGGNA